MKDKEYPTVFEELKAKYGSPGRGETSIKKTREDDMRGKYHKSQEQRAKISQTLKGRALSGNLHSEETNRKRSLTLKGRVPWNKGLHLTKEDKLHKSLAHKGKTHTAEHNRKVGEAQMYKVIPPELRERWSKSHTGVPLSQEHVRNIMLANHERPNGAESKLKNLLDKVCPGVYEYTGDGTVVIGSICPDFTDCFGQFKVIELFGNYWHKGKLPYTRKSYPGQIWQNLT